MPTLLNYDISVLSQMPANKLSEWCLENRAEIQKEISQRIQETQANNLIRTNVDPFLLQYGTELLSRRGDLEEHTGAYLLLRVIDAATRYSGVSCNKILFGEDKGIELFGHPAAFIQALNTVGSEQMLYVLSLLENNKAAVNNAEYVLKERWTELASSYGCSLAALLNRFVARTKYRDVIRNFSEGDPKRIISSFSRKSDFVCSVAAIHTVLVSCLASHIPADYFLMPDYSDCATINGVPLSGIQKSLLSSYLKAGTSAQEEAILYLLNHLVIEV